MIDDKVFYHNSTMVADKYQATKKNFGDAVRSMSSKLEELKDLGLLITALRNVSVSNLPDYSASTVG
jgi:hypothetical protein